MICNYCKQEITLFHARVFDNENIYPYHPRCLVLHTSKSKKKKEDETKSNNFYVFVNKTGEFEQLSVAMSSEKGAIRFAEDSKKLNPDNYYMVLEEKMYI